MPCGSKHIKAIEAPQVQFGFGMLVIIKEVIRVEGKATRPLRNHVCHTNAIAQKIKNK